MKIRLYFDEDSMREALVRALRARDVDVVTALDAGMTQRSDSDHLDFAVSQGRVLVTRNVADFWRLHTDHLTRGEGHTGMIFVQQHRFTIGTEMRGLLKLVAARSAEQMANDVAFLTAWE